MKTRSAGLAWILPVVEAEAPNTRRAFGLLALGEPLMPPETSQTVIRHGMDRWLEQLGRGDACHRGGFGFIYPAGRSCSGGPRGWRLPSDGC